MKDMELQQYNFLDTKLQAPGLSRQSCCSEAYPHKAGPLSPSTFGSPSSPIYFHKNSVEFLPHFFLPAAANMGR
jgi:hypothetical protein